MLTSYAAPFLAEPPADCEPHEQCFSTFQEMAPVIDSVVAVMLELGYAPKDMFGARLALEEAVCNAIKHGHQYDSAKFVAVRYRAAADHFLLEVEDQGPGFDPAQVLDSTAPENVGRPCGRGLLLMHHFAAWVRHNQAGNCVTFCIYPSGPDRRERAPT